MTEETVNNARRDFFKTCAGAGAAQPPSPKSVKDFIIYEIATTGFTSPNGPETETFDRLTGKLPYLEELGITGIWLTRYSICDPHFFPKIWTQDAVIEPDKIDPSLGTEEDFRRMIGDARRRDIKVFLNVITHGVMKEELWSNNYQVAAS